jgi:hypothetical protein
MWSEKLDETETHTRRRYRRPYVFAWCPRMRRDEEGKCGWKIEGGGDDGFADIGIDETIVRLVSILPPPSGLRRGNRRRLADFKLEVCRGNLGGWEEKRKWDQRLHKVLVGYKRPREEAHADRVRLFERGHLRDSSVIMPRDGPEDVRRLVLL